MHTYSYTVDGLDCQLDYGLRFGLKCMVHSDVHFLANLIDD